ncbi:MAG TPA: hypothetical protein VG267_19050 [Terracidiphilus sp.]|jgi:hypothetical protein|nr:hypothetical protein [Terracidiphilus sp.]
MKITGKAALFAAGLFVLAAVGCIGLYWIHKNHEPGEYGKNLEFRVSAFNLDHFDRSSPTPDGADVFSDSQAEEISQTGEPPAGFLWLPLSNFLLDQGGGVQPRGITRMMDGREYLLVANEPSMVLTHAANAPRWGVKSVKMTITYVYGPAVNAIQIELDYAGKRILRQFTQKYNRHSVAVIVDGQVVANFGLLSPMRRGILGLRFPAGEQTETERLRKSLMK